MVDKQELLDIEARQSLDYQTSPTSGASPAQSPYSNRAFWGSYKNLSRGLWGGILVGGVLGVVVGGALAVATIPIIGFSWGVIGGIMGVATLGTTAYYAEKFSLAGATAGAVSTAIEIYEERKATEALEKGESLTKGQVEALERKTNGNKGELKNDYTPENNPADERFRPFYWKVGLAGAILGGIVAVAANAFGFGELLSGHTGEATTQLKEGINALSQATNVGTSTIQNVLAMAGGALAGSTFGINRYYLRQPFYFANALFEGDLSQFTKQREHEKQLTREYKLANRIEPQLEELAPSHYSKAPRGGVRNDRMQEEAQVQNTGKPGTQVQEASWGFELSTQPGKEGKPSTTLTYTAKANENGKKTFEKKFHGSWDEFQKKMKDQLETAAQNRQI